MQWVLSIRKGYKMCENGAYKTKELLLSIIVPVYNVEKYLSECLDSLLDQNLSQDEYEIVCVDDGSTDKSFEILKEYAQKHRAVKIISQPNMGVSVARNSGIRSSQGRYIMFCDSDDMIQCKCLGEILKVLCKENANTANYQVIRFSQNTNIQLQEFNIDYEVRVDRHTTPSSCVWIYDSHVIKENQVFFNENMKYAEDTLFVCQYMNCVYGDKWIKISNPIYYYREREGSAMKTKSHKRTELHFKSMMIMAEEYKKMISQVDDDLSDEITRRCGVSVSNALYDAMRLPNVSAKEFLEDLSQKGLYPYRLQWRTLKFTRDTIRGGIVNYIKFFFPFKWYYLLVCSAYNLIKRKNKR